MASGKVGEIVKQRRRHLGLTQVQLGRRTGLAQNYISKLELGEIELPQRGTLDVLAQALDVPVSTFFRAAGILGEESPILPRTIVLPTRDGERELDLDLVVSYVESKPDADHQRRLKRWRDTLPREDYERIVAKIYVAWTSNADLLLSGLETISGPGPI